MESKELELEVIRIREAIEASGGNSNGDINDVSLKNNKFPNEQLVFRESTLDIDVACIGYDDYFYVIDSGGQLKKYEDIKSDNESIESGFNLGTNYGTPIKLVVMPEGYTLFSNLGNKACIYHSSSIDTAPNLVFESVEGHTRWIDSFGIKSYYNGLESFIMAGVYGGGQHNRELLLSVDGGQSFDIIKRTKNVDQSGTKNSHWHDVAIDTYHGVLWAIEGDGPTNQDIFYSYDLGATWETVITGNHQPTSIIPFPDKVVFGRDNFDVGLDHVVMPRTISELDKGLEIKVLQEFKKWSAYKFFAQSPVGQGHEMYLSYFLYEDSIVPTVIGTGDFGNTWHILFMSVTNIGNFFASDSDYLYAYKHSSNSGIEENKVIYAKKPEWI